MPENMCETTSHWLYDDETLRFVKNINIQLVLKMPTYTLTYFTQKKLALCNNNVELILARTHICEFLKFLTQIKHKQPFVVHYLCSHRRRKNVER